MGTLPAAKQARAAALLQERHSVREVARTLSISIGSVSKIRQTLNITDCARQGRPRALTEKDEAYLRRQILSGKAKNAADLHRAAGFNVCKQTVRNALRRQGLNARVKVKKPLLRLHHRLARLNWARRHRYWTPEDWNRVIWSDETKINRFGSDGRQWAWGIRGAVRTAREIKQTVKGGGGHVMIWGCMSRGGLGLMAEVDGIMDANQYSRIVDQNLERSAALLRLRRGNWVFQQDNDPKHTSRLFQDYIRARKIQLMIWPAQSPDLNPIEHLWDELKRRLNAYSDHPRSMQELSERIRVEWNRLPKDYCKKLVDSIPRRIAQVLARRGAWTDY